MHLTLSKGKQAALAQTTEREVSTYRSEMEQISASRRTSPD